MKVSAVYSCLSKYGLKPFLFSLLTIHSAVSQGLLINELKVIGDSTTATGFTIQWIEIKNTSTDAIWLSDYSIAFDSVSAKLPDAKIPGSEYYIINFTGDEAPSVKSSSIHYAIPADSRTISLRQRTKTLSSITVPDGLTATESYGRYPEDGNVWIFFPEHAISKGNQNRFPGPWQKVVAQSSFTPRDSSPNGVLTYNGKVWILEGWKRIGKGVYESSSDVHVSENGIDWELVNPSPPYNPYSAFIVFDGWMWAFERFAYRSKDGIHWENMGSLPLITGGRVALHNDILFWTSGNDLWRSFDGLHWQNLVVPWRPRAWPGLQSFNGKLWFFGGAANYHTTFPEYLNDVWSSPDGVRWFPVHQESPFVARYWFGSHVFDNKLWILGGYNYYDEGKDYTNGNRNDVWYSTDGSNWFKLMADGWPERHAMFSWVMGDNLFISGGANAEILYNDIWRYQKEILSQQDLLAGLDSLRLTYGDAPIQLASQTPSRRNIHYTTEPNSVVSLNQTELTVRNAGATSLTIHVNPSVYNYGQTVTTDLAVQKKMLNVSVMDNEMEFGSELPEFRLVFDGFVNGDNVNALNSIPYVETQAHAFSPIGTHVITPQGGIADNYSFLYLPSKLIIKGEEQLVVFPIPAKSVLNIISSISTSVIREIVLYSSNGERVLVAHPNDLNTGVDVSGLNAGVYLLVTHTTSTHRPVTTRKIFIQN